ncbi:32754_t:CDS:2 [Racocetra persica]|uniref:32754_t:CDS:1 n=1 Tax=Racocetra persica TaxID=160502 RepID=A0ACA9QWZ2_9GLOM|nr:32754_t:CDS:2 [Racocetra persica]
MSSQDLNAEPFSNTDTPVGSFDEKNEICTREETKICTHEVTARNGRIIRKGRYLPYEDKRLIYYYKELKDKHKNNVFAVIETYMNRSAKSLRERYCNHLDENIDNTELTHDEKTRIYDIYYKLGRRPVHAEIARRLSEAREDGKRRTDLIVRNFLSPKLKKNKESSIRIKTVMAVDALINEGESGSVNLINKNDMSPVDLTSEGKMDMNNIINQ